MAVQGRITPAHLPSLPTALSRRAALFGTVAATGFLGAAATSAATGSTPADAFAALWAEHRSIRACIDAAPDDVDEDLGLTARLLAMDGRARVTPVATPAGAVAALEWAAYEFGEFYRAGDDGDGLVLALIDGALGVLRGQVAGSAA